MAVRASLYLKKELQDAMEKRPRGVSEQLERLFDCYKYGRRRLGRRFTDDELSLLLYALRTDTSDDPDESRNKDWNDDPEDQYGLGIAVEIALDDGDDFLKGLTAFDDEARSAEIVTWAGKVDRKGLLGKIHGMHTFDLLTLIDAVEQAHKKDTLPRQQREIRFLLPRERSGEED
ncbi:MAG: hypothetical protein M3Y28_11110 [Armatimonadota bacterium]|nr:hypothetical protein [Armatimonadota bacterium]